MTRILGIETSCDETAAAIVVDGRTIESSVVSSQIDLHVPFGGVVPEIAGRAHIERITPVVRQALAESGFDALGRSVDGDPARRIDLVAATAGPGLIGSLLVGVGFAKSLALAWDVGHVAVNHLEAHLYSPFLEHGEVELPVIVLLVSGGHTLLVHLRTETDYAVVGGTIDDAAGEAYDKVARYLDLGYPGGPAIDRLAGEGDPEAVRFPRGMLHDAYEFSFSGIKTSVVNHVRKHPGISTADVAASFQEAVVDVLATKARKAAAEFGAKGICLGGGVAANSALRARVQAVCDEDRLRAYLPPKAMCTDNAAMVAAAAWWRLSVSGLSELSAGADPNLRLGGRGRRG